MTTRDPEEQDLRLDQMSLNIEKMWNDMGMENRKFAVQVFLAGVAPLEVGATSGGLFLQYLRH
ncbi:MAG: hypothetical protein U1E70_09315 [Acetobacteraceae bacterium]